VLTGLASIDGGGAVFGNLFSVGHIASIVVGVGRRVCVALPVGGLGFRQAVHAVVGVGGPGGRSIFGILHPVQNIGGGIVAVLGLLACKD